MPCGAFLDKSEHQAISLSLHELLISILKSVINFIKHAFKTILIITLFPHFKVVNSITSEITKKIYKKEFDTPSHTVVAKH